MNKRFLNLFNNYGPGEKGRNLAFSNSTGDYDQRSSLSSILGLIGLVFGVFHYADDGGLWPAFGGVAGSCIGFFIGKTFTVGLRLVLSGIAKAFKFLVAMMRGGA